MPAKTAKPGFCSLVLVLASAAANAGLPTHSPVPGGVAVIPLPADSAGETVTFNGRRVAVVLNNGKHYAIAGLPLDIQTGPQQLKLGRSASLAFEVKDKRYREQHLTIKEKRYVTPAPEELARYQRERSEMDAARALYSTDLSPQLPLAAPVPGSRSDSFGARRFYNAQPRSPHSGMDLGAAEGAKVLAAASGRVAVTGDYFFNGQTVMLDHGQGLVTLYCHLSRIDVQQGAQIERGERLGLAGSTGRVTGAHLHLSVYLSGVAVDPALLLEPPRNTPEKN